MGLLPLAVLVLPLALFVPRAIAQQVERPALRAGVLHEAIKLDGLANESAWMLADSIADLTQIEPREGARPTGRTVVRVLANTSEIIVSIRADDPEPRRIVSFARARDIDLSDEDHVKIVLDTYRDGRSGYVFAVNPNGARYDALITEQGDEENSNWDAVWEAAAARTATGWSAEIRIPLKSLLFGRGLSTWGLNVQRRIQRLQETNRWASPERDYQITQSSRAGDLTDLPPFDLGLGFSVRPSMSAGSGVPSRGARQEHDIDASADVTQRLGTNTLASVTVNTDFAETEVDTRRTNLTRFPLFFPEKRSFFLEGADIFDFGFGLGEDVLPFFSRRIGLLEGRQVPIVVGGKVNGRLGGTNFGALSVHTDRAPGVDSRATMGVVRVKQNVLGESSVGFIGTSGDPLGRANSWLAGPDVVYQTSHFRGDKNFLAGAWALAMDRDSLVGRKHALGGKVEYPNDLWDLSLTYKWLGDGFLPSLGFVPRPGVQIASLGLNHSPRPSRRVLGLPVRQMFYEFEPVVVADLAGRWESYRIFTAPVNWRLESGDRFEMNVVPTGERFGAPFEIADDVVIAPGAYHWNRYRLEAETAQKRRLSGEITWWFGDFYDGRLDELELSATWKPSSLFILELTGERNVGRLPQGRFTQDILGTRVRLNFSADLQLNSFVQYDTESQSVGTNTRLRWTFHPLGDLFVVYNHNLLRTLQTEDPLGDAFGRRRWELSSNQLLVKVQYTFRY